MKIIGLLGGVAAGKSQVARLFQQWARKCSMPTRSGMKSCECQACAKAIRHHFGSGVFGPDGQVNRPAIGQIVFGTASECPAGIGPAGIADASAYSPAVAAQADRMLADGVPVVILDAPVLLKAGWNDLCDALVFVDCPEAVRRARAVARGWTAEDFAAREAAQASVESKRALADFVVDNSASLGYTQAQIEKVWQTLVG